VDLGSIPVNGFEVESVLFVDVSLIYRLAKSLPRIHALVLSGTLEC